jgi:putative transposase
MSQCNSSEAVMTRLNPHGHYISVVSSQTWDWVVTKPTGCQLSPHARARLSWLQWHESHGTNVTRTCQRFGISRPTLYRWLGRFRSCGPPGLEDRSHRPHIVRARTWTPAQIEAVRRVREQYPRWSKDKLHTLLKREGIMISASMIGCILADLRARGVLREAPAVRALRRRSSARPHARRKPSDWVVSQPGDLVEIDTKDLRPVPGKVFKHLSLVDVTSRYAVAEIGVGATAKTTKQHLERMLARLPFPVRALQIDGGSEFKGAFEEFCRQRQYELFVLPPRSPKLNGAVERIQRTFDEECYQCTDAEPRVEPLRTALRRYEHIYNTIRPHQALDYQTPQEYLDHIKRRTA